MSRIKSERCYALITVHPISAGTPKLLVYVLKSKNKEKNALVEIDCIALEDTDINFG